MKAKRKSGFIKPLKDETICRLYQNIAAFMTERNRLQDAAQVQGDRQQSIPTPNLPLIF